jgi:hypothetical protein
MPYIKTIPPSDATGILKQVYETGGGPSAARGKVAMVRQVQSLNPNALAAWSALGGEVQVSLVRLRRTGCARRSLVRTESSSSCPLRKPSQVSLTAGGIDATLSCPVCVVVSWCQM